MHVKCESCTESINPLFCLIEKTTLQSLLAGNPPAIRRAYSVWLSPGAQKERKDKYQNVNRAFKLDTHILTTHIGRVNIRVTRKIRNSENVSIFRVGEIATIFCDDRFDLF